MKRFLLVLIGWLSVTAGELQAQAPVIKWQKASASAKPVEVQFMEDGYLVTETRFVYESLKQVIAGNQAGYVGINDAYNRFVKFDDAGNVTLVKAFTDFEWPLDIAKAADGYMVLGSNRQLRANGSTEYTYFTVVKVDESGTKIWSKTFRGATSPVIPRPKYTYDCIGYSIIAAKDGGFLIAASSNADAGNQKSEHSKGDYDYWVIKMDAAGVIQWDKTLGGSGQDGTNHIPMKLTQTVSGDYIVGGTSLSKASGDKTQNNKSDMPAYQGDYWIVKISSTGSLLWEKTLGGNQAEEMGALRATADGGCMVGGASGSSVSGDKTQPSQGLDYWVLKLNASGNIEWDYTTGGEFDDYLRTIEQTAEGDYLLGGDKLTLDIVAGATYISGDYCILKLNKTGSREWELNLGGVGDERFGGMVPLNNGNILVAGCSMSDISGEKTVPMLEVSGRDFWLLELMPCKNGSKIEKTICSGDSYDFNGTAVTVPGLYTSTLTNQYGCDSTVELTLKFYPPQKPEVTVQQHVLTSVTTHSAYQWLLNGVPLPGATNASYAASKNGNYQLIAVNDHDCKDTSLVVKPLFKTNLFVPNVFSPNGDGNNDILKAYGNDVVSSRLIIFNQWGQKIFQTDNAVSNGWNGMAGGKPQPAGVYVYVLEVTTGNGKRETMKGSFMLVR